MVARFDIYVFKLYTLNSKLVWQVGTAKVIKQTKKNVI